MELQGRKRRLSVVVMILLVLFGGMETRLAWLQLGGRPAFGQQTRAGLARAAFSQRSDELTVDSGRGQFVDRKGRPLTGASVNVLAAFPAGGMPRGPSTAVKQAADALGVPPEDLERWLDGIRSPEVWRTTGTRRAAALTDRQANLIRAAGLFGVFVFPYRIRYPQNPAPLHAVGYISQDPERIARLYPGKLASGLLKRTDDVGGAGLERSLDRLIRGIGPTVVSRVTDSGRRELDGLGLRVLAPDNPHYPLQIRTTIDADIQRLALEAMQKAGVREGAVVVLDAANADILAMVSLPGFDPLQIGAPGTDERNRAITAYAPGSVFKMVTLAAALESGVAAPDTKFRCRGEYGRYGLRCWKREGHGTLTLEEAFAESCNVAFAELAEKLDPAWIQITAERLGLGRQIGWHADRFVDGKPLRLLEEEEAGRIFVSKQAASDGGVRTGTGIGQRDVRVTPLQAAGLVVALLHGGNVLAPRLATEIRYADGTSAAKLEPRRSPSKYGKIQPGTAASVLKAMRAVVTEGTGKRTLSNAVWPLAGKSGTAELAGRRQGRNDHWFVGYGPAKGVPRYAVAVLIQNQPAGLRNRAAAVFGDIMEQLRLLASASPGLAAEVPAAKPKTLRAAAESTVSNILHRTAL